MVRPAYLAGLRAGLCDDLTIDEGPPPPDIEVMFPLLDDIEDDPLG